MGASYEYSAPRHIVELRSEAKKRYNSIKVQQMPLSYSGFFSKSVFRIQKGAEQIQRATSGSGGPTKIVLVPDGELITIHVDNYLTIHVEPLRLPHRQKVNPYINTYITEPTKGVSSATSAPVSNTQKETPPKARKQPAKKKATATNNAYLPARKVTVAPAKDYDTRDKAQAGHFKRIQLEKIQINKERLSYLHKQSREAEQEAKKLEEAKEKAEAEEKTKEAQRLREAERELLQTPPPLVINTVETVEEEPSTSACGQILELVTHMDIKEEPILPITKESFASFEETTRNTSA